MSPVQINGHYFDGSHITPTRATLIRTGGGGASVIGDSVATRCRARDLRVSPRMGSAKRFVSLPNGGQLLCADSPALDGLGQEVRSEGVVAWLEQRWTIALASLLIIVGILTGAYFHGLPVLAERVAGMVQLETEAALGETAVDWMDRNAWLEPSRLKGEFRYRLESRFADLIDGLPNQRRYTLMFRAAPSMGPNAMAFPGGIVVITDELIHAARNEEEVLAVMAHEIGHVERRHALRGMLHDSVIAIAATALFADASSVGGAVAGVPTVLTRLKYSREFESEADDFAFALLARHGISPAAFADAMESISEDDHDHGERLAFLSSHPVTEERMARARGRLQAGTSESGGTMIRVAGLGVLLLLVASVAKSGVAYASQDDILGMLRNRQFTELEKTLNGCQPGVENNLVEERRVHNAFTAFELEHREDRTVVVALSDWVQRSPQSYAARTARGIYFIDRGKQVQTGRGPTKAQQGQLDVMREWFDRGRVDLIASLDLCPAPLMSHIWLLRLAMRNGPYADVQRYFRNASTYAHKSLELRLAYMRSLEPDWGGTLEDMQKFARESESVLGPGFATNTLWGLYWFERVAPKFGRDDYAGAHEILMEGLARHESPRLYCARAFARMHLDRWPEAMTDLQASLSGMRSGHSYCTSVANHLAKTRPTSPGLLEILDSRIALNPADVDLLRHRGWVYFKRGNSAAALQDLRLAAERGDSWARGMVGTLLRDGAGGMPSNPEAAVDYFRNAAHGGDSYAQQNVVQLLRSLGREQEAQQEDRIYRVSEKARSRADAAREPLAQMYGPIGPFLDPRVQAVGLGALAMGWIAVRVQRRNRGTLRS